MKRFARGILIGIITVLVIYLNSRFTFKHAFIQKELHGERLNYSVFMLSPKMEKLVWLEYEGLRALQLSIQVRVVVGGEIEYLHAFPVYLKKLLVKSFEVITTLNPYYFDVYYYMVMFSMWDLNDPKLALRILKKGIRFLPTNGDFYFYLGFLYFYFLHEPEKGAFFFKKAGDFSPHSKKLYYSMASRLYYQSGRTLIAIKVLEGYIKQARSKIEKRLLIKRWRALKEVYRIEKAIENFERVYKRRPKDIEELLNTGFLREKPVDPYGGRFYIDEQGRVKSTSNFTEIKK